MEEIKTRLAAYVADKLSAAPDSAAKTDLIEELSENLYQRYQDLTASGVAEEEAFRKAADDLGDTAELVDYLKSLQPDEPLPEPGSDWEDLMKNVSVIVKSAMSQAKNAIDEVRIQLSENDSFHWESEDGSVEVHVGNADERTAEPEEEDEADVHSNHARSGDAADRVFRSVEKAMDTAAEKINKAARKIDEAARGMSFTFDVDTDDDKFVVGGTPKQEGPEKDVIYGVGYDKDKGGFFAQWGEYKGSYNRPVEGPVPSQALRGIDVQTVSGDVTIRMTEDPDGDVIIDGDVNELDVRRSDDGVLTITQGKTASSSFFFGRGLSSADVILYLPRRRWDFLKVSTVSGDVQIDGDNEAALVSVKTTSGDLEGGLPRCDQLQFKSVSGDLDWRGDAARFSANTTSGDLKVAGHLGETQTASISGDVRLEGAVTDLQCSSTSGDVWVRSGALPRQLNIYTRSGDATVFIPDRSPFAVHYRTGSGTFRSDFFTGAMGARENTFTYGEGEGPTYHMTSSSGDLRLKKF